MKKKYIKKNEQGITSILDLIISVTIIFIVIAFFFSSFNNFFTVYEKPDIDLQAKILDMCEILLTSPGQTNYSTPTWENDTRNTSNLGLATSPLIIYGAFNMTQSGKIYATSRYTPGEGNNTGLTRSCFLSGTKIVMANESYKNIEDIQVGDVVKSFDFQDKIFVNGRISQVFHHQPDEMGEYYLIINNFLQVTPNHLVYVNGTWRNFSSFVIGDKINTIRVDSIEKIYTKVPTYNVEVEDNHNYIIYFPSDSFLVHNSDIKQTNLSKISNIDWRPWVPVIKASYPDIHGLEPYGGDYFVEYTRYNTDFYLYEIKEKENYPYVVVDFQKCINLSKIPYGVARFLVGLDIGQFAFYDFIITIRNNSGVFSSLGPSFHSPYIKASITRNIVIYHRPNLNFPYTNINSITPPYYEQGQITVSLFLGGSY